MDAITGTSREHPRRRVQRDRRRARGRCAGPIDLRSDVRGAGVELLAADPERQRAGRVAVRPVAPGETDALTSYDQHTRRTPPGPVAGLTWVRENIDFFLRYVPARSSR